MDTKINGKSRVCRECVFRTFWGGLGTPTDDRATAWSIRRSVLGAIFCQKSPEMEKGCQRDAKYSKKLKKTHLKNDAKIDTEKESKMTPTGFQNSAKIYEQSTRFRNLRFIVFW